MVKILSIGNSFSQDAHRWLYKLAKDNNIEIKTSNLYIGGCSLEMHWKNYKESNKYYEFWFNGETKSYDSGIAEALELEEWDIVTLQQVSQLSGMYETYEPYLSSLATVVKNKLPNAKLYFHQTWAYEIDSTHEGFVNYEKSQNNMFNSIKEASKKAAETINAKLIPTGTVIQTLRETVPEFNYKNGGVSLCRDGFHLSLDYGRFAAAATWLHTITGQKIKVTKFEDFNTELLNKILDVVNNF